MKLFEKYIANKRYFFLIIISAFLSTMVGAQETKITDYVLFGGSIPMTGQTTPAAPGYSVQLGSAAKILSGSIGSYSLVLSTGNISVSGNIVSGGKIELANSNVVLGRIAAANSSLLTNINILKVGSNANLSGAIDVNGNIQIGGGTVSGIVTHPIGTQYVGPEIGARNITGTPNILGLPQMPPITSFPAVGSTNITNSQTITPGVYGDVVLTGNKTLTFSGVGTYVFKSIKNSGTSNDFVYDFINNTTGNMLIYVHGDVDLNKAKSSMVNGGNVSRIYYEIHGTGFSSANGKVAFNIANGSSGQASKWLGTIWAPYAAINIGSGTGSTDLTGALWSGTQVNIQGGGDIVHAPFPVCTNRANADAGSDKPLAFGNLTSLLGTSNTPGATFSWQALNGGVISSPLNAASITVSAAGTYVLTVQAPNYCLATDTAIVTGKVSNIIGSELGSIYENGTTSSPFFNIQNGNVLIDVIVKSGQYTNALSALTSIFGMTDIISNGASNLIITGFVPISNLLVLNSRPDLFVYCRPYYAAVSNHGIVTSAGDTAVKAHMVRGGYDLSGDGIKVGVLSDSYNTILSATVNPNTNTASQDINNGDLPPAGVSVLQDAPYRRSDEGRAMFQIIHDLAPNAELVFRTGFNTPGDMAQGIGELFNAGCNVIVDDVTFISEPFLKDGVIAQAVNTAVNAGAAYFSAAGNFANKSYENVFHAVPAPGGLPGKAHNFGNGDVFQNVTLTPGNYTIVLQWVDNIYSLGQPGTANDLDFYLTPNTNGTALFGFNRNNTNGDPIEFVPFIVTATTNTNILIINSTPGIDPARFKFIVFKGDITFNEYASGTATLVGQANAAGAIAVGAARYDKASPYSGPLVMESFSSSGGTLVEGTVRSKPELTGPDGVNTTVRMGIDYDHNNYSNFFGTSAAAPHVAAVAALIMEGRKKYLNQGSTPPSTIRSILQSTAVDMGTPGFDYSSGYGFVNADAALRSFALPKPELSQLVVPAGVTPGLSGFTLTAKGQYFSPTTVLYYRDIPLTTTYINAEQVTVQMPLFIGDPAISLYTPPISSSQLDGGRSDSLYFFNAARKNISVTADNLSKKYGQSMPVLTATVLVDGVPLNQTNLTLTNLGLNSMTLNTAAISSSEVGTYIITPSRIFVPGNPSDMGFLEIYNYSFNSGSFSIEKLPVTVTANNMNTIYGEILPDVQFTYSFDETGIPDPAGFRNAIRLDHQQALAKDASGKKVLGIVNASPVSIVNGEKITIVNGANVTIVNGTSYTIVNGIYLPIVNSQALTITNDVVTGIDEVELNSNEINNLSFSISESALQNTRKQINKKLINGVYVIDSSSVIDIAQESILDFNVNSAQTYMLNSVEGAKDRGLIDVEAYTSAQGVTITNSKATIVNGNVTITNTVTNIVNGANVTIVNGANVTIVNGLAVTITNSGPVPIVNGSSRSAVILDSVGEGLIPLKSINTITGLSAGNQFIIPGSLINNNFQVTHIAGLVTIVPALVTITPAAGQNKVYGTSDPTLTYTNNAGLAMEDFTGSLSRVAGNNVGTYGYQLNTLSAGPNYVLALSTAVPLPTFVILAKSVAILPNPGQSKVYGSADPVFTFTNSESLTSFTGALGRVSGNNAGTYTFTLGSLSAGINYTLYLQGANAFIITPALVTITPAAGQNKVYGTSDPTLTYTNNAGLAMEDFTGSLSRVAGNNVGTYGYQLNTLSAGPNYVLALSTAVPLPTFVILAKSVAILPNPGQSKVYGSADPVFTFTNSESLTSFTGALGRVSGNNAGTYTFTLGSLSAGINYTLYLQGANAFIITPAGLTVKANDNVIYQGDALPTFTSTVTGLKNSDNPAITYVLNPAYTGAAGEYIITPSIASALFNLNYIITYSTGVLYVNPKGPGAKKLRVALDCVVNNPPGGPFLYTAKFQCYNDNATTVYVPIGPDNNITSAGSFDASAQPVVFRSGITLFNVPFDGTKIVWELKTFETSHKTSVATDASSNSRKCNNLLPGSQGSEGFIKGSNTRIRAELYPNPASNRIIVNSRKPLLEDLRIYDVQGKLYQIKITRSLHGFDTELNISTLHSGMYWIRLITEDGPQTIRFLKL